MSHRMSCSTLISATAILLLLTVSPAWSASYKILHSFSGQLASNPSSGLVLDKAGNAYGTTSAGGFNKAGAVYQLSPKTGFHVIYGFSGPDGRQPQGNLAVDAAGNLYGTTVYGGANQSGCNNKGCGTVFRLSPPANGGAWTETVLYSFTGGDDGSNPQAGVILDSVGNLYGSTQAGGIGGGGIVFELSANQWTEKVLHSFDGGEGAFPVGGLIFDAAGNLYGTTQFFGGGTGTAFELSPPVSGENWTLQVLYVFGSGGNNDAVGPAAALVFDQVGNLYGTTAAGGEFNLGTVFELLNTQGTWTERVLHSFAGGRDGAEPLAGLVVADDGSLYGTTFAGGAPGFACLGNGCGTVFRLVSDGNDQWAERSFAFPKDGSLGVQPTASLLVDKIGHVFGTTAGGGALGAGVIFRITP